MNDIFDIFDFSLLDIAVCPNCNSRLSIQASNKSVGIRCSNCNRQWFYRRIETVDKFKHVITNAKT